MLIDASGSKKLALPQRRGSYPYSTRPSSGDSAAQTPEDTLELGRHLASSPQSHVLVQLDLAAHLASPPKHDTPRSPELQQHSSTPPRVRPLLMAAQGSAPVPFAFDEFLRQKLRLCEQAPIDCAVFAGFERTHCLLDDRDEFTLLADVEPEPGRHSIVTLAIQGSLKHDLLTLVCAKKYVLDELGPRRGSRRGGGPLPLAQIQQSIWSDQQFSIATGSGMAPSQMLVTSDRAGARRICVLISAIGYNDLGSSLDSYERKLAARKDEIDLSGQIKLQIERWQVGLWTAGQLLSKLGNIHTQHEGGLRDVKSSNLLFDEQLTLHFADNEFAAPHGQPFDGGSLAYLPPRLMHSERLRRAVFAESDVWAMAQVLVQLILDSTAFVVELRPLHGQLMRAESQADALYRQIETQGDAIRPHDMSDYDIAMAQRAIMNNFSLDGHGQREPIEVRQRLLDCFEKLRSQAKELLEQAAEFLRPDEPEVFAAPNWNDMPSLPKVGPRPSVELVAHLEAMRQKLQMWSAALHDAETDQRIARFGANEVWSREITELWTRYRLELWQWCDEEERRHAVRYVRDPRPLPTLSHDSLRGQINTHVFHRISNVDRALGWGPRLMRLMCTLLDPDPPHGGMNLATEGLQILYDAISDAILQRTLQVPEPSTQQVEALKALHGPDILACWQEFLDEVRARALMPRARRGRPQKDDAIASTQRLPQAWRDKVEQLAELDDQFRGEGALLDKALYKLDPADIGTEPTFRALARLEVDCIHPMAKRMDRALRQAVVGAPGELWTSAQRLSVDGMALPHDKVVAAFAPSFKPMQPRKGREGAPSPVPPQSPRTMAVGTGGQALRRWAV